MCADDYEARAALRQIPRWVARWVWPGCSQWQHAGAGVHLHTGRQAYQHPKSCIRSNGLDEQPCTHIRRVLCKYQTLTQHYSTESALGPDPSRSTRRQRESIQVSQYVDVKYYHVAVQLTHLRLDSWEFSDVVVVQRSQLRHHIFVILTNSNNSMLYVQLLQQPFYHRLSPSTHHYLPGHTAGNPVLSRPSAVPVAGEARNCFTAILMQVEQHRRI